MRDIASCFSEHAVSVADTASCASSQASASPIQNASTSVYKVTLSTQKRLTITVTWCNSHSSRGLTISFDNSSLQASFKLNTSSMFKRLKGAKCIETKNSKMEVLWDLCAAKYQNGPEPVDGYYYVLIMVDSELGLSLGNMAKEEANKRIKKGTHKAKASLVSRIEHCSGSTLYSTKAKFSDAGALHDISIRCVGEGNHDPSLSICIDKKTVIHIKRLQWNFRGNQNICIDGLAIDLLWDVHDWLFSPASGYAVFAFRATEHGQWSDQKHLHKPQDKPADFSLLIYACKTS